MAETTGIGWCDSTQNFWWGCNKVSEECRFCYIEGIMKRAGHEPFGGPIRTSQANWRKPYSWNREARIAAERRRVFTCSMSDFFHPGADAWREDAWAIIKACGNLDWLILTKRPELMSTRMPEDWGSGYPNVWLGVTVGRQSSMDRIPLLKAIPARVRFISAEPLLEKLDFRPHLSDGSIHWVITGCEQAAKDNRRLMDLEWVRDIDQQCREANVAHYFKQYYVNNSGLPVTDGLLDGTCRQAWPIARN
jgi:protein gp37